METTLNNLTTGKDEGSTRVKRGVSEIITDIFEPFDHRGKIVTPFDSENKRDADFQEKLSLMLLELMLDFHAWSSARPLHESDKTADRLEKEINELIETEKDQGMFSVSSPSPSFVEKTRQRLKEFIDRIKMALAALTALTP
ncbi:hypothetical protein QCA50_018654 [Cerrena zonata]|uniref:Uncharacterized protein n=1 Tax=Cerrena zonata TaxID=2478898 RepID=A0AAW0FCX5_9APHY